MFSYNLNFFPTPVSVIEMMGIDCQNKIVLEPSSGKGDIIEWLKNNGAKEVLTCEYDTNLAEIVKTKSKFIKHDFLKVTPEEVSHIDMIVANPPFSNGDKHILHMWNVAPDGCEIISLVNYDTYKNSYSSFRHELKQLIADYGCIIELGEVFSDSERKTEVNVGLIKLYKPKRGSQEFEGFFLDEDEEEVQENGIMKFDAIKDVVQRYIYSVKCFEEFEEISGKMNKLTSLFDVGGFTFSVGHNETVCTKDAFKKELQKKAWKYLFGLMNLKKYLTSGVMDDINKFVENQTNVPFTMKNIYKMFDIIIGTRDQIFERALVESVDRFTMHTHENRYNYSGWKSNSGHMLNKKFIVPYLLDSSWSGTPSVRWGRYEQKVDDLIKVLSSISGKNDNIISLDKLIRYRYKLMNGNSCMEDIKNYQYGWSDKIEELNKLKEEFNKKGIKCEIEDSQFEYGKWMDWGFFEIKGFKKGTVHFKFKDEKLWEQLNRAYAKAKGQVLPEKFKFKEPKESKNKKEDSLELIN